MKVHIVSYVDIAQSNRIKIRCQLLYNRNEPLIVFTLSILLGVIPQTLLQTLCDTRHYVELFKLNKCLIFNILVNSLNQGMIVS